MQPVERLEPEVVDLFCPPDAERRTMTSWQKFFTLHFMNAPEITAFVHRLLRRELTREELAALSTRDLDDINLHLAEFAQVYNPTVHQTRNLGRPSNRAERTQVPQSRGGPAQAKPAQVKMDRTYSEQEILAELGWLE